MASTHCGINLPFLRLFSGQVRSRCPAPKLNKSLVYVGACLIAGIRIAREKQVHVRVIPRFKQSSSHSKRAVPPCMNSQSCSRSTFVSELLPEDVPMDRLLTGLEDNRLEGI